MIDSPANKLNNNECLMDVVSSFRGSVNFKSK